MISSGAWTLFRANALCLVRRLLPLVRANPVIFCLVVLGPVAFLAGLAWAGARDAAALAASPGDGASTAIVLTVGVLFALVGFSVRHVSSIEGSLDAQIRSAPLSRLEMFLGTVGIPFSACCLAVSVSSLVLLAPLFHAVGARPYAPVQLALFEAAAFYAAGAVGEVFARATRRRPAALLALPLLVLAWVGERSCDRGRGMAWYRWTARAHGHEHRDGAGGGAHARLALSPPRQRGRVGLAGRASRLPGRANLLSRRPAVALPRLSVRRRLLRGAQAHGPQQVGAEARPVRGRRSRNAIVPDLHPASGRRAGRDRGACAARRVQRSRGAPGDLRDRQGLELALEVRAGPPGRLRARHGRRRLLRRHPCAGGPGGDGDVAGVPGRRRLARARYTRRRRGGHPAPGHRDGFLVPCSLENASEQILSYAVFGASLAGVFAATSWAAPRLAVLGIPELAVEAGLLLAAAGLAVAVASRRSTRGGRRDLRDRGSGVPSGRPAAALAYPGYRDRRQSADQRDRAPHALPGRRQAHGEGDRRGGGGELRPRPRRVTSDFLQLVARLNEKCLLNVKTPLGSRLAALPRVVKLFLIDVVSGQVRPPWHRRRLDLRNESKGAGFLSVVSRLSPYAAVMGSALSLAVWLLVGDVLPFFWMTVSVALAFAASLVIHEASHAMALAPVPAFLSVYGPVFLVGHREIPPKKGFFVSAAGPVITGASGSLVVLMSGALHSEHLVFVGEVLVMNLLGMTTLAADGRKAVRNLALAGETPEGRSEMC